VTGRQLISRIVHLRNKPEEKKRKNLNKNPHQGGAGSRTHQTIVPSANLLADLKKKKKKRTVEDVQLLSTKRRQQCVRMFDTREIRKRNKN
jgi:hypothetical protein